MQSDQISLLFLPLSAEGDLIALPLKRVSKPWHWGCHRAVFSPSCSNMRHNRQPGSSTEHYRACVPQIASVLIISAWCGSPGRRLREGCGLPGWGKRSRALEGAWASEKGRECCWSPGLRAGKAQAAEILIWKPARSHWLRETPAVWGSLCQSREESCQTLGRGVKRFAIPCSWCCVTLCCLWSPPGIFLKMGFPVPGSFICSVPSSRSLVPVKPPASPRSCRRCCCGRGTVFDPGLARGTAERVLAAPSSHPLPCPLLSPQGHCWQTQLAVHLLPLQHQHQLQGRAGELGSITSLRDPHRMCLPWQVSAAWHSNILTKVKVLHKS